MARTRGDRPGVAAVRPPLRPGRGRSRPSRGGGRARTRFHPGGRSGEAFGIVGRAAPRQGGARAGDVAGSARRRQAAFAARHRFAHGRRAAKLARERAQGRLADRGVDAQPQRLGACRSLLATRLEPVANAQSHVAGRNGKAQAPANGHSRCLTPSLEAAPAELLTRIEDLSGDQVDALLAALLDEKGHGNGR